MFFTAVVLFIRVIIISDDVLRVSVSLLTSTQDDYIKKGKERG